MKKNYYALGRFHINKYATSSNGGLWDGNVIISCDETLLSSHTNWTTVFVPNCDGLTAMGSYLIIDKILLFNNIPVVPARGGAEVALKIYIRPFSPIELACAVRQPSPCVRAFCESGVLFHMSHLKLHFALHTSHCTLHNLHTPHFTLHASHCTVHTSQSTLHTSQSTLHTSQSTLHTSHSTLHTSHSTLHTALFLPHTSHCTLHLIWALLTSSQLISSHLISSHMSSKLSWITSQYYY